MGASPVTVQGQGARARADRVATISICGRASQASRLMRARGVDRLAVLDHPDERTIGVVTQRDVVRCLAAMPARDPRVGEIMAAHPGPAGE